MQVQLAMKNKGGRDDITVIVVDALTSSEDRLPCLLQKTGSGIIQAADTPAHTVAVTKPLELHDGNRPWYPLEWCVVLIPINCRLPIQPTAAVMQCMAGLSRMYSTDRKP